MRLALLVVLGLTSAAHAQQQPPSDPTPPPIDRSVPNSGTSRTTDDAAKPTEKDGSLMGSSGSSTPAPLGPNDPKAPAVLNGKESTRMPTPKSDSPKSDPTDSKPDK
jgi:hypothetical protein